jgi:hypothetical protein
MRLPSRRPGLPGRVRAAVRGRPLASAEAGDGTWLVGTRDALFLVPPGEQPVELRWERVHRADWDLESSTLTVERVEAYGQPVRAWSFVLAEPGALVTLLRERVTASIVLQRRVDLDRRRGFTVIGRRAPSGAGPVAWAYEFDRGVDPSDPAVLAVAEAALRDAQGDLGLA